MTDREELIRRGQHSHGGIFALPVVVAGYKIIQTIKRDHTEDWFCMARVVADAMPDYPEIKQLRRSISNKVGKLVKKDSQWEIYRRRISLGSLYHRKLWLTMFDMVSCARGELIVTQMYSFLRQLYINTSGLESDWLSVLDDICYMSPKELSHLMDDLRAFNRESETTRKILELSPPAIEQLLIRLGHGRVDIYLPQAQPTEQPAHSVETVVDHLLARLRCDHADTKDGTAVSIETIARQLLERSGPDQTKVFIPEDEPVAPAVAMEKADAVIVAEPEKPVIAAEEVANDKTRQLIELAVAQALASHQEQQAPVVSRNKRWMPQVAALLLVCMATTALVQQFFYQSSDDYYQHRNQDGPRSAARVEPQPDNPEALYGQAFTQYENGNLELSLSTLKRYETLIEDNPRQQARLFYLRGMIYTSMGSLGNARRHLNFAATAYEEMWLWGNAGRCHLGIARTWLLKDQEKAWSHLSRAREHIEYSDDSYKHTALDSWRHVAFDYHLYAGNIQKANSMAGDSLIFNQSDTLNRAYALSNLSMIRAVRGDISKAIKFQQDIDNLDLASDYLDAYNAITQICIKKRLGQPYRKQVEHVRSHLTTFKNHSLETRLAFIEALELSPEVPN